MIILILIVSIAVLIIVHELGHFWAAKFFKVKVEEFGFGFPPKIASKKKGETEYSLNLLPLGGFVRLYGEMDVVEGEGKERSFMAKSVWKRLVILVAGVVMNFILGWIILSSVFAIGSEPKVFISEIAVDSPAEVAGFEAGDIIQEFISAESFIVFVDENRGRPTAFSVSRGNNEREEIISIEATPRINPPEGEGSLGVAISEVGIEKLPILKSFKEGFKQSVLIVGAIFKSLGGLVADLFDGGKVADGFVGPVGIYTIASETSRLGILHLMQLIAVISLNLAVLNILPIPALDGGRVLFIAIEKIKGSPVKRKREGLSHAIGFIVLILLLIAITIRDVAGLL